ncbi:MAG TPA: serine hydroxymethyltransferase, partial [Gammaproteobacteria bacterium]|nr:serine hydroxymethyltransferase [Gammaproteobacteria bacterium]
AQRLFGAGYANVQPYSGSQANLAAYLALLEPGDTLLAMSSAQGGHRTHGAADNLSGKLYNVVSYGVDPLSGEIDYAQVAALARRHRPKLVVAGFSAYSRTIDWQRFRVIADDVDARLLADMAHVAGLVAAGLSPNPVPIADLTTTTTHKTLRGPRGGMILARAASPLTERVDAAVFPGTQGGPLMHVIAAKAVAFEEALQPQFKLYQQQVLANARLMARCLIERGHTVVSGGTDNHMLLIDLSGREQGAQAAERALERAHIAVNRVAVPSDATAEPQSLSGLRLGTPAITTRGFAEAQTRELSDWVADLLDAGGRAAVTDRIRAAVLEICGEFPVYAESLSG